MVSLGKNFNPAPDLFKRCEAASSILYCYNSRSKKLNTVPTNSVNNPRTIMFGSGTSDPEKLPPCQVVLTRGKFNKKVLKSQLSNFLEQEISDTGYRSTFS